MKHILLTADSDQVIILVGYIVGILLTIIITRAIFSIGTIVRNLKAQTALLALMAEKNGVDVDSIRKHVFASKDQVYKPAKQIKPIKTE